MSFEKNLEVPTKSVIDDSSDYVGCDVYSHVHTKYIHIIIINEKRRVNEGILSTLFASLAFAERLQKQSVLTEKTSSVVSKLLLENMSRTMTHCFPANE